MARGVYKKYVRPLADRHADKYHKGAPGECWLWTCGTNPSGYGCIKRGPGLRTDSAHRVAWELHRGPIPPRGWVLHHCDRPACVNPDHLYVGTPGDNMRDMVVRERKAVKLDKIAVRAIRATDRRITSSALAVTFGVAISTVCRIRNGTLKRHVS